MSQRDGFTGGFIVGSVVGGIVGGIVGVLLTAKRNSEQIDGEDSLSDRRRLSEVKATKSKKRQLPESDSMEVARRSLEDKIAQLNSAIDEVRLSLGNVNSNPLETQSQEVEEKEEGVEGAEGQEGERARGRGGRGGREGEQRIY
jgi:gas vesicle protein